MRIAKHLAGFVFLFLVLTAVAASAEPYEWETAGRIEDMQSFTGEFGAAFHDGELYAAMSERSKEVRLARYANGQWTPAALLAFHRSSPAPELAVLDGKLHMIGSKDFKIWHSTLEGTAWSNPAEIPGMETRKRSRLGSFGGALHVSHCGMNMDRARIFHAAEAGWGWGHNVALPDQHSRSAGAMAGLGDELHMVYVARNSETAWHTYRTQWGEWTPPMQIPGADPGRAPDLVRANGKLFLVFARSEKGQGGQRAVAYCEYAEGRWTAPTVIEGYVTYGAPVAAVEPGLPQHIHLLLPNREGALHLRSAGEATIAPVRMKQMKPVGR